MAAKIYKISKESLTELASESLKVEDVKEVLLRHIHDGLIADQAEIPFSVEVSPRYVPSIEDEDIMIVIREKVDATARGPHAISISNAGEDVGQADHDKKVPYRPWELPQGFVQIKGENE